MSCTDMQLSTIAFPSAHTYHMSTGHNICQGLWDFSQLLSYPDLSGPAPLQSAPVALEYRDLLVIMKETYHLNGRDVNHCTRIHTFHTITVYRDYIDGFI